MASDFGRIHFVYWGPTPQANNDTFSYDDQGRLTKQTRRVNGQLFAREVLVYDELDRPTQQRLPNGEVVAVTYDQEGENTLTAGGTVLIAGVIYNERGQLVTLDRAPGAPDMNLTYYNSGANFGRLNTIRNGANNDAYPDYAYTAYDSVGNLKGMTATQANAGAYTFTYDELDRLKVANLTGAGAANFNDLLGNITRRTGTDPDLLTYEYGNRAASGQLPAMTGGPQAATYVDVGGTTEDWRYDYDARGNLDSQYIGATLAYDYTFDGENRLASVRTSSQTTTFAYDADGQRVMTARPDGTVIYTPFPDYEREVANHWFAHPLRPSLDNPPNPG